MVWNPGNYPNYISISSYSNLGELSLARQLDARKGLIPNLSLDSKLMPLHDMDIVLHEKSKELEKLLKELRDTVCGLKVKADGTIGTDDDYEKIDTEKIDGDWVNVYKNKHFDRVEKWFEPDWGKYIKTSQTEYVHVIPIDCGQKRAWKLDPKRRYIQENGKWKLKKFE